MIQVQELVSTAYIQIYSIYCDILKSEIVKTNDVELKTIITQINTIINWIIIVKTYKTIEKLIRYKALLLVKNLRDWSGRQQ